MTHAKIEIYLLAAGARAFELDLSPAQLDQFARYAELLIEWNLRFNLTSIVDPREIVMKHFLDSLSALRSIPPDPLKLIDVGAGAGLPGLPIKLARPEIALTLLGARGHGSPGPAEPPGQAFRRRNELKGPDLPDLCPRDGGG